MGFLDIDDLDDDRLRSPRISDGTRWERIPIVVGRARQSTSVLLVRVPLYSRVYGVLIQYRTSVF